MTIVISILVVVAMLLGWGGWQCWRTGDRKKALLMAAAALVLLGNAAIWITPTEQGTSLIDQSG